MSAKYDIVGIGNAIVDVLAQTEDSFIDKYQLTKGGMALIDASKAEELYSILNNVSEVSGGSAANTCTVLSSLGGSSAFLGKTGKDQLGKIFKKDISANGVYFEESGFSSTPTARCFVFVTPDAERTMQTFLGACADMTPDDIDKNVIERSAVTYIEGYLWDTPKAREAILLAASIASSAKKIVSLSLSDSFCVDRHRDSFIDFIKNHVDLLFANEDEIKALFELSSIKDALNHCREICEISAITRGGMGSIVNCKNETYEIEAEPVKNILDTTGAGDAYAGGFIRGLAMQRHPTICGKIGSVAASEIISHFGARPEKDLYTLIKGLI
ncbi:MAG: Inosine-guanosine kinase [Alphaproteobacteria bacterium MarineAlpha3_Bin7]|nr:MAG: Inosine-guanosine kinase [Alphaproteobacteria bacterium MarineAlpha3_Bin7]